MYTTTLTWPKAYFDPLSGDLSALQFSQKQFIKHQNRIRRAENIMLMEFQNEIKVQTALSDQDKEWIAN